MLYVVPGEVPEIPQQKCLYIGKISIVRMDKHCSKCLKERCVFCH